MTWQDLVNGLFETSGGFFILLSVLKLLRDKRVYGVHWLTTAFFMSWGWWNLYYYPHLGQWVSFGGGVFLVGMNTIWVGLLLYYARRS